MDDAGAGAGAGAARDVSADRVASLAKVHVVLGWAAALFVVLAVNIHHHQGQCAATEAEAASLRADALLLALSGPTQAAVATVAACMPAYWRPLCWAWTFNAFAHGMGVTTFRHLFSVAPAAVEVAAGTCHHGTALFISHFVLLAAPLFVVFVFGLAALFTAALGLH